MHLFVNLFIIGCFAVAGSPTLAQPVSKAETNRLTTPATVAVIELSITKSGGKATLNKYFCLQNDSDFTPSYDLTQVATGSKVWVDLAVKMLAYSDAGCTQDIQSYLGSAMQKKPLNVLPHVGKSSLLSPAMVCLPFISADIPIEEAQVEVKRTKAALLNGHDKVLNKQCQQCLAQVAAVEKSILANMTKKK